MAMKKEMEVEELLLYADQLAAVILQPALDGCMSYDDVMKSASIAYQLVKAVFPAPERLFALLQEAEGTLECAVLSPRGSHWN